MMRIHWVIGKTDGGQQLTATQKNASDSVEAQNMQLVSVHLGNFILNCKHFAAQL
jgi:hypothetical protein